MKEKRTKCVAVEEEVQYVVVRRASDVCSMGCFIPAGPWHIVALCGDDFKKAKQIEAYQMDENVWCDVEIWTMTDEEIKEYPKIKEDDE